jgi:general transcriptional corepressor TUP1
VLKRNTQVVRIWDARTGELLERLRGHKDSVYSVAFTPDARGLVSGSLDKTLKYWDVARLASGAGNGNVSSSGRPNTPNSAPSSSKRDSMNGSKKDVVAKESNGSSCIMNFIGHKVHPSLLVGISIELDLT